MCVKNLSREKIFCFIPSFIVFLCFTAHLSLAYNYFDLPGIKGYQPPNGFPWNFEPKTAEQVMYLALWKIFDVMYTPFPLKKEPSTPGPAPDHHNTIDLKINHRTTWWLVFPKEYFGLPNSEMPDAIFQPEFLRRESFIIPEKGWPKRMPEIKSYEDLPKPPRLLMGRFKEHRPMAKEVLERLKQRYGKELE